MVTLPSRAPRVNPKPRPRQPRPRPVPQPRLQIPPTADRPGLLTIAADRETADYELVRIPADFGIAFRLEKLQVEGRGPVYHVCLDADGGLAGHHLCECLGQERWGFRHPCKHITCLLQLLQTGVLSAELDVPPAVPCGLANTPHAGVLDDDLPF